jgi:hypothetical protein
VRLKISAPPLLTMACHCKGCQRLTSSAYSLSVAVPTEGFEVTRGEPVIGALHGAHRHYYCPHCMSWMFTRAAGLDYFVNVRATLLDDADWFEPYAETATGEKLPWVTTPAVHGFEGFPPADAYGPIVEAYAGWAGRKAT